MPVYNAMPYLEEAIRSIYAQSYQNWELIIVDDASADGSWEFVCRFRDPRVRVCRNQRNMGHSYTVNRGIALASGDYIAKMDADDISFPDRIERQVEFLMRHQEVDAIGCGLYRVDKDLNLITVNRPPASHKEIVRFISLGKKFVFGPSFPITDGCLVAKTKWFKMWNYDPDIPYAQDFDQNLRSHYTSVFANIPEPLYVYRRVGVTSSWLNQTKAVYYKLISLMRYGFRKNNLGMSLLALVSLTIRPLFAYLTSLYVTWASRKSYRQTAEGMVGKEQARILRAMEAIKKVTLPLAEEC
jgi:glycosyltransferase involved in cell wall biosynthesis